MRPSWPTVTRSGVFGGGPSRAAITGLSADVIAELVAELGPLWHDRHQARLVARPRKRAVGAGSNIGWSSSIGSWPRWCTSAMGPPTTCWPAGSALTGPPSPGPSAKSGLYRPSEAAPSPRDFACGRSPRSSTTSVPAGRPGSSTAQRSASAGRPSDARTGTSSSPARTGRTPSRPWSSPTRKGGCCSAAQPSPQAAPTSPTPAS